MMKIAVSSGDPAGIGPDICIKAFGQKKIYELDWHESCEQLVVFFETSLKLD